MHADVVESLAFSSGGHDDALANDLRAVHESHALVAIVTYPSIGVGWSITSAIQRRIPILALDRGGAKHVPSRFVREAERADLLTYRTYGTGEYPAAQLLAQWHVVEFLADRGLVERSSIEHLRPVEEALAS